MAAGPTFIGVGSGATCYDIEGNVTDCAGSDATSVSGGQAPAVYDNPVAASASSTSSPSWLGSLINFGTTTATKLINQTNTTSNLRLQINPTTGQMQYYNPATGQYVGGPVNTSGSLFSGGSGFLLLFAAVAIGFLAFFKRK
jgi:hypothetical protein